MEVRPKPVRHSVRWIPHELPEFDRPADRLRPFELFVRQPVFRYARSALTGSGERFGFLLGQRFHCPESRAPWVLISEATPPVADLPGRGEEREFRRLRNQCEREAASQGLELVGWYHEHRYLGVALTGHEVALHRTSFLEPWQCALIFVCGPSAPSGAFIQPWRGELYFGQAVVSFQELIEPADEAPPDDPPFSTVDWCNHVAERPVQRGERLVLDGASMGSPAAPERDWSTAAAARERDWSTAAARDPTPAADAADPKPSAGARDPKPTVAFRLHSRMRAGRLDGAEPRPPAKPPDTRLRLDVPLLLPRRERPPLHERVTAWVKALVTRG